MPRRRRPPRRPSRRLIVEIGALLFAAAIALGLKIWAIGVYRIPSASMLPALMPGDYLLVEKWPFALAHRLPRRGEMVVLRQGGQTYVKRAIGLPGDRIALRRGRLILNDQKVPHWRVADFLFAPTAETPCLSPEPQPEGPPLCRAVRIREMPTAAQYHDILDGGTSDGDDFGPVTVPAGRIFLLGDNRDRSADSRTALGMVKADALVGRAGAILFSSDGRARLSRPGTWAASIRWDRIGSAR